MAGNSFLNPQMVTREALALFLNSNNFLKNVDRQYDDQFAKEGAKIGNTLKIRLPNDYIVSDGPNLQPQGIQENFTPLAITRQKHVDIAFTSVERALNIQDYKERYLKPAMNALAGYVAVDIMSMAEQVPNFVGNFDGQGNLIDPIAKTWLGAGAMLDQMSVMRGKGDRMVAIDEWTQAATVSSLAGFFNSQSTISEQNKTGEMSKFLGFEWMMDQTMIKHTTGQYGALPTVNGAGQTGNVLTVSPMQGTLNVGDIITVAGVNSVNRTTKQDNGKLQQFVVTAPVAPGATVIPIYPSINPPAVGGAAVAYQTVTASPANGAPIACVTAAGLQYRKNLAFNPKAFTVAFADLIRPTGAVIECEKASFGGVSLRLLTTYVPGTDQVVTRMDVLYGFTAPRGEWAVVVPGQA